MLDSHCIYIYIYMYISMCIYVYIRAILKIMAPVWAPCILGGGNRLGTEKGS